MSRFLSKPWNTKWLSKIIASIPEEKKQPLINAPKVKSRKILIRRKDKENYNLFLEFLTIFKL